MPFIHFCLPQEEEQQEKNIDNTSSNMRSVPDLKIHLKNAHTERLLLNEEILVSLGRNKVALGKWPNE